MSLVNRISNLLSRSRLAEEIDAELQSHIEMRAEDNIAAGMSPEEATRDAKLRFGNPVIVKEKVTAMDVDLRFERILAAVRFAGRLLRRKPLFAAIVVSIMALAISAATVAYSVVDVWLVRTLPFRNPERLVALWRSDLQNPIEPAYFTSWRDYEEWRHDSNSVEEMAGFTWRDYTLKGDVPERVLAQEATPNLLTMLGVATQYGRIFSSSDEGNNLAVLSYDLWQRRFNSSAAVLGSQISLNDRSYTVIGIMARGFNVPSLAQPDPVDVWIPLASDDPRYKADPTEALGILAYIRPGKTLATTQQELGAISRRLDPEMAKTQGILLVGLQADLSRSIRPSLLLLMGAVSLIVFIACFNVAGLLTNRAIERSKEISVRTALGARRIEIVWQLLIEALLLGLISEAFAVLLSSAGLHHLLAMYPFAVPPAEAILINWRVLLFTMGLTALTTCGFGIVPAVAASRVNLNEALKQGSRTVAGGKGRKRLRTILLVGQVTLSVLLLSAAGLLGRSFLRLESLPLGFQPDHILTATIYAPPEEHGTVLAWNQAREELFRALQPVSGVKATGAATHLPFTNVTSYPIAIEGKPLPSPDQAPLVAESLVTPGYFETMQIPWFHGRDLSDEDRAETENVAVINRAAANLLFPNDNPIGKEVRTLDPTGRAPWFRIVGVTGDTRSYTYNSMEWKIHPEIYFSFAQAEAAGLTKQAMDYGQVVVRTSVDPSATSHQFREAIVHVEPSAAAEVQVMTSRVSTMLVQPKLRATIVGIFAFLALLLVGIGLYGLMSQTVLQQTREIGTRMALGAQRSTILAMILHQGLRVVLIGLGIGVVLSLMSTRMLGSFLYSVSAYDPFVFVVVCVALLGLGGLATYLPARAASVLDPIKALQDE
jgi:predicted permease